MPTKTSTVTIRVAKAKVWEALTKPALVKQWQYGADLVTDWKPGSKISFRVEWPGGKFEQWGKVIEFRPPDYVSYSLFAPQPGLEDRPENYFEMRYQLVEQNGVTVVSIIQNDSRPAAGTTAADSSDGENDILKALKAVAEGL
jgi:uncharacterized protein YndB with AHSA1/START domain